MSSRLTSARFVGRTAELEELRAVLSEATAGKPSMAFVAGESGVGKTRLLSELERAARADGVRVIGGECVELGEGELPYAPIVGALRPLARAGDPAFSSLSPAARAALAQILPGLGRADDSADDEATAQARLFDALLELLELLAGEDGLLVTIEDLHWADRSTRAFLVYLASSLCRERVLVVTTYRPDELHRRHPLRPLLAELERDARALRVELHPLTRAELAQQLEDILGASPREDLLDRLFARSEGNPLFAEELLAAGMDGRGALPPTLRDALMLRIERLSDDAQELLRLLAAGRRLDHQILADASGEDSRVLREALREAVAAQLVVPDEEGFYAFRHALLREVVVDDLLPGERAELHLALARALERRAEGLPDHGGAHLAAGIAYHYLESGDQPAALAAIGSRRRGRRGRPRQRRGRGAVLARAEALGSRGGRRGADRPRPRRAAAGRRVGDVPRARSGARRDAAARGSGRGGRSGAHGGAARDARAGTVRPGPVGRGRGDASRRARPAARRAERGARDAAREPDEGPDDGVALPRGR